jgi:hypothetical protein
MSTPGDFLQQICNRTTNPTHIASNGPHRGANTGTSNGSNASYFTKYKLQKWSIASQDISWNPKFPELKERVEGHFIQALMGHCVQPNFINT